VGWAKKQFNKLKSIGLTFRKEILGREFKVIWEPRNIGSYFHGLGLFLIKFWGKVPGLGRRKGFPEDSLRKDWAFYLDWQDLEEGLVGTF